MKANERLQRELDEERKKAQFEVAKAKKEVAGAAGVAQDRVQELEERLQEEMAGAVKRERDLENQYKDDIARTEREISERFMRDMEKLREYSQRESGKNREQLQRELEEKERRLRFDSLSFSSSSGLFSLSASLYRHSSFFSNLNHTYTRLGKKLLKP
jgi:gas vesicle protein